MIHLQDLNSSVRAACVIVSILMYIQMTETILKLIESCGLHLKFDTALKYVIAIHIHIYGQYLTSLNVTISCSGSLH